MVVDRFCVLRRRLDGVIRMLEGPFHWFRWVMTEGTTTFRADDGSPSPRFGGWERIHNDIFDPIRMVTRTAAISVPIARSGERFVGQWLQWLLVHRATPQTMRTL